MKKRMSRIRERDPYVNDQNYIYIYITESNENFTFLQSIHYYKFHKSFIEEKTQ